MFLNKNDLVSNTNTLFICLIFVLSACRSAVEVWVFKCFCLENTPTTASHECKLIGTEPEVHGNIFKYDFVIAMLTQLTSTSMHSLSFLQVADMVSVVPNSKYHSLFFILQSQRKNRGQIDFH